MEPNNIQCPICGKELKKKSHLYMDLYIITDITSL